MSWLRDLIEGSDNDVKDAVETDPIDSLECYLGHVYFISIIRRCSTFCMRREQNVTSLCPDPTIGRPKKRNSHHAHTPVRLECDMSGWQQRSRPIFLRQGCIAPLLSQRFPTSSPMSFAKAVMKLTRFIEPAGCHLRHAECPFAYNRRGLERVRHYLLSFALSYFLQCDPK